MHIGLFLFGSVYMPDAGLEHPKPVERRYDNEDVMRAYEDHMYFAELADKLGYDSFWLSDHHFQHEGYEVFPNPMLFGAIMTQRTRRIKFGSMFVVTTQWHPLRLAEDFAVMDIMTGGRMLFGVGRGTVPREGENLGTQILGNVADRIVGQDEADIYNRKMFEEGMAVIKRAFQWERFSFEGEVYRFPVRPLEDRGNFVTTLTLVPRPRTMPEFWQPVTSPKTFEYVAREGHRAVFWLMGYPLLRERWASFGEMWQYHHAKPPKRALVTNVVLAETVEEAMALARPGHDEFWKFLGDYGWQVNYVQEDGSRYPRSRIPTLEESLAQRVWFVGTPEAVAEELNDLRQELGIDTFIFFSHFPHYTREMFARQLELIAQRVIPRLRAEAGVQ